MSEEVILTKLEGLKELTEEKFCENEKQHTAIITQTTKTNGRVRLLEKFIWGMMGAGALLAILLSGFVLPLVVDHMSGHEVKTITK